MMIRFVMVALFLFPVGVFAMADRTPPVYGRPTLYGEYEITSSDIAHASKMYGNVPGAIRVAAAEKTPAAKHPVRAKKAAAKKKKSAARASKKESVKIIDAAPVQVAAVSAPPEPIEPVAPSEAVRTNIPSQYAQSITGTLRGARDTRDVSSFCTRRRARPSGKMPDGYVLMPGRPDLMSCVDK